MYINIEPIKEYIPSRDTMKRFGVHCAIMIGFMIAIRIVFAFIGETGFWNAFLITLLLELFFGVRTKYQPYIFPVDKKADI